MSERSNGLKIKITRDAGTAGIPLPSYATDGSAGMDLRSADNRVIEPGEFASIGTGLRLEIPEGYEAQVRPRSGLAAKHGVTVLNSPGTIDSDYRGEIRVLLINHGKQPFAIEAGDRIAQIIFSPVTRAGLQLTDTLTSTERSSGGFGSTGIR